MKKSVFLCLVMFQVVCFSYENVNDNLKKTYSGSSIMNKHSSSKIYLNVNGLVFFQVILGILLSLAL